jgi:hypothetical protein
MGRARLASGIAELSEPANRAKDRNLVENRGACDLRMVRSANASPLPRDLPALAIFLALTLVMTNPLPLHLASAVEDKQDALLNTWIIAWVGHALITHPLDLFNANIFYPYPNALAFSETMLPQGLFALPLNLAFDNTVLGYNLVLLASFFLAAYAMYLFVLAATRSRGAAIVAGTIFAFNPYNLGNLAQIQLLSFGWLPLAMLFLRRMLTKGERRGTKGNSFPPLATRASLLFAIFFSLQALSSFYYAFFAGFAVALYAIWAFIVHRPRLSALVHALISFAIITMVVVPFFLPYLQVQRDLGFQRRIEESEPFSASLKLYTEVSPQNVLYGGLLAPRPPIINGCYPLDNLFPGIIPIALAIIGIAATKNRERWFFVLLFAFAFLLSLGPRLFIAPNIGTDIPLPYRGLYDVFPLLHALRAPVRFDALVMFALAVLAGLGIGSLSSFRLSSFVALVLIALEYLALPAANTTPVPTGNAIPPYVRWLAQQPPGVVIELPMIAPACPLDLTTQYLSTYHWQATPDGYSGFVPPLRGEIAYEMQFFPNERSISLLQALGVEYVIVHSNQFKTQDIRAADLQLAQQFGADWIYRLEPRVQDARALTTRLYLPQPAAPNQSYFAYIVVENHAPRSFAILPTDMPRVDARWSDGTSQRVTAAMPLVTSSLSVVQVRLTAPLRAGDYHLELRVAGNAIGEWNLTGDVAVKNEEPAHQVVLPAQVFLKSPLQSTYAPGDTLNADLVWLAQNKINAYYSASVRVVDARGNKVANDDRQPGVPTLLWTPGSSVPDRFALALPRDLAPGEYTLQVLMYQADQGIDARLLDAQFVPRPAITLGAFTVK